MNKKTILYYAGVAAFLAVSILLIYLTGSHRKREDYETMLDAASRLSAVTDCIRKERLARGIPLTGDDILQLGLLGEQNTQITTSMGMLEAKRTAQLPDMAALCVRLFTDAGLQAGDKVGACFSGSFPGINLAVICAADAMGLEMIYSAAIGSSTYGANLPGYTCPEMMISAYEAGLISAPPSLITMGGMNESGRNMMGVMLEETDEIEAMKARYAEKGLAIAEVGSQQEAVRLRTELFGKIDAFVNVGGNVAGTGMNSFADQNNQGILKPQEIELNERSGLMEYYLHEKIPVLFFLNIRKLSLEYGILFDPEELPAPGSEGVYYERRYSKGGIAAAALVSFAAILLIERDRRKRKEAARTE